MRTGIGAAREDVNVSVTRRHADRDQGRAQHRLDPRADAQRGLAPVEPAATSGTSWPARGVDDGTRSDRVSEDVTEHLERPRLHADRDRDQSRDGRARRSALPASAGSSAGSPSPAQFFAEEISDRVRGHRLPDDSAQHAPLRQPERIALERRVDWRVKQALGAEDERRPSSWSGRRTTTSGPRRWRSIARAPREAIDRRAQRRRARPWPDGTNGFERILPGPDRMYPDTDLAADPDRERAGRAIRARLPVADPGPREQRYRELGVPADACRPSCSSIDLAPLFERAVTSWRPRPRFAAASPRPAASSDLEARARTVPASLPRLLRTLCAVRPCREAGRGDHTAMLPEWCFQHPDMDLSGRWSDHGQASDAWPRGDPGADCPADRRKLRQGRRFQDDGRRMRRAMGLLMAAGAAGSTGPCRRSHGRRARKVSR
ncbi:MAG: hypothetical protein MZU84_05660 [Sphingobacterium sp.]|nr:hypothetical protein [Sphingobacterium sp.]